MTKQNSNTDRKAPVTHKDLALIALMQGVDALDPMLKDHTDPVGVLEKVLKTFQANSQDTTDLEEKISLWRAAKQPGVKGRKPATLGDSRAYNVQQIGDDGDLFIRLPVKLLGVGKGDKVTVEFTDAGIVVRA